MHAPEMRWRSRPIWIKATNSTKRLRNSPLLTPIRRGATGTACSARSRKAGSARESGDNVRVSSPSSSHRRRPGAHRRSSSQPAPGRPGKLSAHPHCNGMIGTKGLLQDRQNTLKEPSRIGEVALGLRQKGRLMRPVVVLGLWGREPAETRDSEGALTATKARGGGPEPIVRRQVHLCWLMLPPNQSHRPK